MGIRIGGDGDKDHFNVRIENSNESLRGCLVAVIYI